MQKLTIKLIKRRKSLQDPLGQNFAEFTVTISNGLKFVWTGNSLLLLITYSAFTYLEKGIKESIKRIKKEREKNHAIQVTKKHF